MKSRLDTAASKDRGSDWLAEGAAEDPGQGHSDRCWPEESQFCAVRRDRGGQRSRRDHVLSVRSDQQQLEIANGAGYALYLENRFV